MAGLIPNRIVATTRSEEPPHQKRDKHGCSSMLNLHEEGTTSADLHLERNQSCYDPSSFSEGNTDVDNCETQRETLSNIVVFGDSYSKSDNGDTWVSFLAKWLRKSGLAMKTSIHNLAFPGATAEYDLSAQVSVFFDMLSTEQSRTHIQTLDAKNTTYFIFLGINDCGAADSADDMNAIIETVFDAVHDLYIKAKARHFVLIDVPPIDRSPQAIDLDTSDRVREHVAAWNERLRSQAAEFRDSTAEASVALFSSYEVFEKVLDDPEEYDFCEDDVASEGGKIWSDELHLTSEVHDIFADHIAKFLLQLQ